MNFAQVDERLDSPERMTAVEHLLARNLPVEAVQARLARLGEEIDALTAATVLDGKRQHFLATSAGPMDATPREASHCQYVIGTGRFLCITDTQASPTWRRLARILVGKEPLQAYLGFPLRYEGQTIGSVCAVDAKARAWSSEDQFAVYVASREIERLLA